MVQRETSAYMIVYKMQRSLMRTMMRTTNTLKPRPQTQQTLTSEVGRPPEPRILHCAEHESAYKTQYVNN